MFRTCRLEMGVIEENGMAFGASPIGLGINCGEMRNWARVANYALQNKPQTAMIVYEAIGNIVGSSQCMTASDQFRFISGWGLVCHFLSLKWNGRVKLNVTKWGIKSGTWTPVGRESNPFGKGFSSSILSTLFYMTFPLSLLIAFLVLGPVRTRHLSVHCADFLQTVLILIAVFAFVAWCVFTLLFQ